MSGKDFKERMAAKWFGVRMAEEALKVDDLSEVMQLNRDAIKAHNRTFLDNYEEGEMGSVHVGDIVNNGTAESPLKGGGVGKGILATMLVAALAGGGGIGYLVPLLLSGQAAVTPDDTDTKYSLGLGKPDTKPEEDNEVQGSKRQDQGR